MPPKLKRPGELAFQSVTQFLENVCVAKPRQKTKLVEKFIQICIWRESRQAFDVFRLILPGLDLERGNYKLLELKLADVLLKACNVYNKDDPRYVKVKGWKRPKTDAAGNFALVMKENLFDSECMVDEGSLESRELTVSEVNQQLDLLVANAGNSQKQAAILGGLIRRTTPTQMRWITQIILKGLKVGVSEKTLFKLWHPSAEDFYNSNGMSLSKVFNELVDRGKPVSTEIEPGSPVKPQLAQVTLSVENAFKKMHKKDKGGGRGRTVQYTDELRPFLIETKFDGERIQVHRCPGGSPSFCYYTRNGYEHGEKSGFNVLNRLFEQKVVHDKYMLDGELLVRDKSKDCFVPFGNLKSVVNAARDGKLPTDMIDVTAENSGDLTESVLCVKDVEIWYIAFDILYVGNRAVISLPLSERHKLLKAAIRGPLESVPLVEGSSVLGRIVPLLPDETLISGVPASVRGHSQQDIQDMLDKVIEEHEEGIVVKALDSPWIPDDRHSGHWSKLKPDYVKGFELDGVIIGAWYGEGRRGGSLSKWLLAIYDKEADDAGRVPCFLSFARVGSGLSDEERRQVYEHLKDNLQEGRPPKWYKVSGREKPDLWVADPFKSLVLQLLADMRLIASNDYATEQSVRFPRVDCVRFDKGPRDATSTSELKRMLQERQGKLVDDEKREAEGNEGNGGEGVPSGARRSKRGRKGSGGGPRKKRKVRVMTGHRTTDVSKVAHESEALGGALVYFVDYGDLTRVEAEAMAARLGGRPVASDAVTGIKYIFAERKDPPGFKLRQLQAADRDIISLAWLKQCAAERRAVPLRPRHYIHLSAATRETSDLMDRYGDSYLSDVDASDVDLLLRDHMRAFRLEGGMLEGLSEESEFEGGAQEARLAQRRLSARHSPRDLLRYLDTQLSDAGLLDAPATCMRDRRVFLLDVAAPRNGNGNSGSSGAAAGGSGGGAGGPAAAAGSGEPAAPCTPEVLLYPDVARARGAAAELAAQLRQLRARQLKAEVQLHGAELAPSVDADLTELVCLVSDEDPPITPEALLEAVSQQGGGPQAVAALKKALLEERMQLVTAGWLEETFQLIREDPSDPRVASTADHLVNLEEATHVSAWPWERFEPPPVPASRRGGTAAAGRAALVRPAHGRSSMRPVGRQGKATQQQQPRVKAEPKAEPAGEQDSSEAAPAAKPPARPRRTAVIRPAGKRKSVEEEQPEVKVEVKEEPGAAVEPAAKHAARAAAPAAAAPVALRAAAPFQAAPFAPALAPATAAPPEPAAPAAAPQVQQEQQAAPASMGLRFDDIFGQPAAPPAAAVLPAAAAAGPSYMVPIAAGTAQATDASQATAGTADVPAPPPAGDGGAAPGGAKLSLRERMRLLQGKKG